MGCRVGRLEPVPDRVRRVGLADIERLVDMQFPRSTTLLAGRLGSGVGFEIYAKMEIARADLPRLIDALGPIIRDQGAKGRRPQIEGINERTAPEWWKPQEWAEAVVVRTAGYRGPVMLQMVVSGSQGPRVVVYLYATG
jgi:hypothetical protein